MGTTNDFVEVEDLKFADQLEDFGEGLDAHGALLGFLPAEIQDAKDDAVFVKYVMGRQSNFQDTSKGFTGFKNLARYGFEEQVMPGTYPVFPVYPVPQPAIRPANAEARFRQRAGKAKSSPSYSDTIGLALHIVAPEDLFDPLLGKPTFKVFMDSGHPLLKWVKGRFQGVEIWVDRGTGFAKLDRDFQSPFVDRFVLPPGQNAVWKYKMIYLLKDATIGLWSGVETVTVYGDGMA